ncbi:34607_t:CDS:2, partial [Racocetra persica]
QKTGEEHSNEEILKKEKVNRSYKVLGLREEAALTQKNLSNEYGEKYGDDQLNYVLETMPNAIQLPVDQTRLPCSKPAKTVIAQRTNNDYK